MEYLVFKKTLEIYLHALLQHSQLLVEHHIDALFLLIGRVRKHTSTLQFDAIDLTLVELLERVKSTRQMLDYALEHAFDVGREARARIAANKSATTRLVVVLLFAQI